MTRRILLIDDDPDLHRLARFSLERVAGWELIVVSSGAAGIEQAAASQPDLILLDRQMPDLDGPATLRALRGDPRTRDVPVVFLTATDDEAETRALVASGALAVIVKPFDPWQLPGQVMAAAGWSGAEVAT